jgi:hypothetical protein
VFPTIAGDNLDVVGSFAQINYPGGGGITLEYGVVAGTGTAFDNVLTRSTTVTPGVTAFARNLQTSANPSTLTVGSATASAPTSVNVVVLDAASRAGATGAIAFNPTVAIAQPTSNPWSSNFTAGFTITANNANVTNCPASGCGPSGTTTPVNPTTTTFTATAAGVSALLGNPFSTVQIWYQVGAGPWFLAGTTGPGSSRDTGVGGNRFWDFTFTWDPPAAAQPDQTGAIASLTPPNAGTIAVNVMAIGMNANGDALFTASIPITLTNP